MLGKSNVGTRTLSIKERSCGWGMEGTNDRRFRSWCDLCLRLVADGGAGLNAQRGKVQPALVLRAPQYEACRGRGRCRPPFLLFEIRLGDGCTNEGRERTEKTAGKPTQKQNEQQVSRHKPARRTPRSCPGTFAILSTLAPH